MHYLDSDIAQRRDKKASSTANNDRKTLKRLRNKAQLSPAAEDDLNQAFTDNLPKAKRVKLSPTQMTDDGASSMVYKSLFDNSKKVMANDGMDGKYEGDFMTRSAKFGLQ